MEDTSPRARYIALQLAQKTWHCTPENLPESALAEFSRQYARQCAIERAIVCQPAPPEAEEIAAALEHELSDTLQQQGFPLQARREIIAHQAHVTAILAKVARQAPVPSSAEIMAWYQANLKRFRRPSQRQARHLLLTIEDDRTVAYQHMTDLINELREHPTHFAELAMRHSHCPSALEGGLLGWVSPGLLFPELDQCLFSLDEGALSPILETEVGLHVLRCDGIREAQEIPQAQALAQAETWLIRQAQQAFQRQWIQQRVAAASSESDKA